MLPPPSALLPNIFSLATPVMVLAEMGKREGNATSLVALLLGYYDNPRGKSQGFHTLPGSLEDSGRKKDNE